MNVEGMIQITWRCLEYRSLFRPLFWFFMLARYSKVRLSTLTITEISCEYPSFSIIGERQQKKLSRRKLISNSRLVLLIRSSSSLEKRLPVHSTTAALAGTRTWLWSNPND